MQFRRIYVYFTRFVRQPTFYGQFSMEILVAVQGRFYCNTFQLMGHIEIAKFYKAVKCETICTVFTFQCYLEYKRDI